MSRGGALSCRLRPLRVSGDQGDNVHGRAAGGYGLPQAVQQASYVARVVEAGVGGRIAAGMTHAQLAARAGPGAVTGPPRLWTDNDHDAVPLGLLERLCQVLDLHPAELFQPPARGAQRGRALPPSGPPGDETVLEAALATVTTPSGQPGTPIAPAALADALGWSLERLTTALAALTEHLAGTGIRIDTDPAPAGTPVRGLRARDRHLSDGQRAALHRLRHATTPLDAGAARVLYAVAHPRGTLPRATPPTRPPSSPSSSAGSSAAVPAPATSSSPTTPGSPSRRSRPTRTVRSHLSGAATLILMAQPLSFPCRSTAATLVSVSFHSHLCAERTDRVLSD